jgi:hypothetical protein
MPFTKLASDECGSLPSGAAAWDSLEEMGCEDLLAKHPPTTVTPKKKSHMRRK